MHQDKKIPVSIDREAHKLLKLLDIDAEIGIGKLASEIILRYGKQYAEEKKGERNGKET